MSILGVGPQNSHKLARVQQPIRKINAVGPIKEEDGIEFAEMPERKDINHPKTVVNEIEVLNENIDPFVAVYHDIPGVSMIAMAEPTTEILN